MTITALRGFVANEYAQSDARAEALRLHANATVIEAAAPERMRGGALSSRTSATNTSACPPARHLMVATC